MADMLYLEDLAVGQVFSTQTKTVTEEEIKEFATQFDPQPFHLDDEHAKTTLFGGLAASGWHTAAMTMRLLVETGPQLAGGVIGGGGEINWPTPTRPGDVLHVDSEVLEIIPSRSRPDRGMIVLRSDTKNQHGEIRQSIKMKLVAKRRPSEMES
jgi:acyl dehydratase